MCAYRLASFTIKLIRPAEESCEYVTTHICALGLEIHIMSRDFVRKSSSPGLRPVAASP